MCKGDPNRIAPGSILTGVVDFVEDDESIRAEGVETCSSIAGCDLLIGGDETVDIAREAIAGGPVGVQLQTHSVSGL